MAADRPRTPPHSMVAEEALLGAMLLSRDAIAAATATVEAGDFYRPAHARVYEAIVELHTAGDPADAVTVSEALAGEQLEQIGGLDGLLGLQMNTPAISNAATYAELVASHAQRRRIIEAGAEIVAAGYEAADGDDASAKASAALARAVGKSASRDLVHLSEAIDRVYERWEQIEAGTASPGQPTGIAPLDNHLGGLHDGNLIVVGARTGVGKTSFGLSTAWHIACSGRPVLICSLEMSAAELAQRQMLALARATDPMRLTSITDRAAQMAKITAKAKEMATTDIWIDESPEMSVHRIRAQAAALKGDRGDLGLVVVDYLQLVRPGDAETRTLEVAEITRALKLLAREIGCPVLAMSQLTRRSDHGRGAERLPQMSDLRESGAIEQDADVVILLHRPAVSRPMGGGERSEDVVVPERIVLVIPKNRHGTTGRIDAQWYPAWALITVAAARTSPSDPTFDFRNATSERRDAPLPYRD